MGTIARRGGGGAGGRGRGGRSYIAYLREYCKKKLDREIEKGYNINVSSYAIGTLDATEYDETYTEYRVQKWIEGVIMR